MTTLSSKLGYTLTGNHAIKFGLVTSDNAVRFGLVDHVIKGTQD